MIAFWYVGVFVTVAVVFVLAVPVAAWLERRSDRLDKEAFERMVGTGADRLTITSPPQRPTAAPSSDRPTFDPWSLDPWSRKA